jgi:threonine/homoserine/homoserine lactone efflux protein
LKELVAQSTALRVSLEVACLSFLGATRTSRALGRNREASFHPQYGSRDEDAPRYRTLTELRLHPSDCSKVLLMLISHSSLLLFVTGAAILLVIPGPAVTYIVSRSVAHGRSAGLVSVLGISTGTLFHIVAATLGLSALLASSALAFQSIKYVGAAYLIYLGIKTLLQKDEQFVESAHDEAKLLRLYGQGLVVCVLNPKTALFFLAFLPQFVDAARGHVTLQILQLGILFAVMAWCSDSLYALIAGTVAERIRSGIRLRRAQRNVSGGALIALGLASAVSGGRSK